VIRASNLTFSTVTGFFLQDNNATDPSTFLYNTTNFGLINRTYPTDPQGGHGPPLTQWQRFTRYVEQLNCDPDSGVDYKVLFMGRHGEGLHNAAESYYGTPAWNCYWAEIDGNATTTWADAHLDSAGIAQAQIAHNFWAHEIDVQKISTPDSFYVSPLSRCLETANVTFHGLPLPASKPFKPVIKELLREGISIHTCDRRSSKAYIQDSFPSYTFEPEFAEQDPCWNGVTAETTSAQAYRSLAVLQDIFGREETGTWVSITSHSGEIASILSVLGHREFSLSTGAVIPVLIKAQRAAANPPTTSVQPWTASAHCTSPPITSISNGACVCQSSATPVTTTLSGSEPINTGPK
jgi:broad specificity phosphatase PhoE